MTVQEKFKTMLVGRGMFDSQADQVIEAFKIEVKDMVKDYGMTWNRPSSEYPDFIYTVLMIPLFRCAIDWIDANLPRAWYRSMFV